MDSDEAPSRASEKKDTFVTPSDTYSTKDLEDRNTFLNDTIKVK